MAKYQRFEELPVWNEAARLYNAALDLLEQPNLSATSAFRSQLERASLSVSNNIAEGFERSTTEELQYFIGIARGSAGEVRSMVLVVKNRPGWRSHRPALERIQGLAESCCRQLTAWDHSVSDAEWTGRRHRSKAQEEAAKAAKAAKEFRLKFLRALKTDHPLYNSSEARNARGEVGL